MGGAGDCCSVLWEKMGSRCKMGKSSWRKKGGSWKSLLGASGESSGDEEFCFKKNAVVEISKVTGFSLSLGLDLPFTLHRTAEGKKMVWLLRCKVLKLFWVVRDFVESYYA
jgi:hypothetical protein